MKINWSKTREQYPLLKKKIIKKTISSVAVFIVILVFMVPIMFFDFGFSNNRFLSTLITWEVIIFVVLTLLSYLYHRWYFAVYYYELGENFLVIKKGPITPHEINIPYERIQDVYMDQDILDRIFGLYDVHVSTVTTSSNLEAHIDGVGKESSEALQKLLLDTVQHKNAKR